MTTMFYKDRGLEKRREETCKACGLRLMCGIDQFTCINEHSDHYGHVLTEMHPACAAIIYRRELHHVPIYGARKREMARAGEDAVAVAGRA